LRNIFEPRRHKSGAPLAGNAADFHLRSFYDKLHLRSPYEMVVQAPRIRFV